LLHLLHAVTQSDVADLVTQHARDFTHVCGPLDETAVDVDPPARNGERVHLLTVHYGEVPGEIASIGRPGELIAEAVDVAVNGGIPDQGQHRVDLRRGLRAQLHFLLLIDGAGDDAGEGTAEGDACLKVA
jgi:hypothetical protein